MKPNNFDGALVTSPSLFGSGRIRAPAGHSSVELGRHLGSFIQRGTPGPLRDPNLGLSPETTHSAQRAPGDRDHRALDAEALALLIWACNGLNAAMR